MTLRTVDLPTPADLNHRWASIAAVYASRGWDDVRVDGDLRYHHDGGGNWAAMALLPHGRALLLGHDHEYSQTYFGEAAAYFGEPETDLLAGAPTWWGEALSRHHTKQLGEWVGFAYGWEGGRWQRADYAADDGFGSLQLPMLSHEGTVDALLDWLTQEAEDSGRPAPERAAVEAVVVAGPGLRTDQLALVVGADRDAEAGVAQAARFTLPPP